MSELIRKLNIVNENDEVIGEESRQIIHEKGLLHREVHVWFYTPKGEIIFQHRAKNKDTYPDMLDATAAGHVEIGQSYDEAALKEIQEETGLRVNLQDLQLLKKIEINFFDSTTKKINHALAAEYVYLFNDKINNLKIEPNKALGFEVFLITKVFDPECGFKKRFIPTIFLPEVSEMLKKLAWIN